MVFVSAWVSAVSSSLLNTYTIVFLNMEIDVALSLNHFKP